MNEYIYIYYGGKEPESEEEGAEMMARWGKWLDDLGDKVVNPGNPCPRSEIVKGKGSPGRAKSGMNGYSIIKAENMDQALQFARECPVIGEGGDLEVAEIMDMPG